MNSHITTPSEDMPSNTLFHPAYFTSKPPFSMGKAFHSSFPAFLKNVNEQLQLYLSDEKLDVRRLTRLVGMSRSDLHRKLTQTVGLSTTAYIRRFRLYRASELLLQEPEWSVYQVALETGFSSQSYFSRRFKEIFGRSPAAWRAGKMKLEHM